MSKIQMYYHMSVDRKRLLESTTVILTFSKPLRDKVVKCVVHLYSRDMFVFYFAQYVYCFVLLIACEQAHLRVTRASNEEQSDPAGRSLVKRCQESDFLLSPRAIVLQFSPALQRKPARKLYCFLYTSRASLFLTFDK